MRRSKKLLIVCAFLTFCVAVFWFASSIQGGDYTYEVRPNVSLPQYKTDATRAIEAYERLMERYMSQTEKNFGDVNMDMKMVIKKLGSIDSQLRDLSIRMARIEKSLGIETPKPRPKDHPSTLTTDKLTNKTDPKAGLKTN